jgi:prepilin-type N-terminal cleavage/methylation domain-containing protein
MRRFVVRAGGFTLVELLVVVAIVAVLIGILLPALARVRDQAQTTACLSNMRQLGIAFQLYGSDYKGMQPYIPKEQHSAGDGYAYIAGGPAPGYDINNDGGSVTKDGWLPAPANRCLNKYLVRNGSFQVFHCPSDQGVDLSDYWPGTAWDPLWAFAGTSYLYNDYMYQGARAVNEENFWGGTWNMTAAKLRPAAKFVLFFEPPGQIWPHGEPATNAVAGKVFRWHLAGGKPGSWRLDSAGPQPFYSNVIFADGHGETVDFSATYKRDEKGAIFLQDRRPSALVVWYLSRPPE